MTVIHDAFCDVGDGYACKRSVVIQQMAINLGETKKNKKKIEIWNQIFFSCLLNLQISGH